MYQPGRSSQPASGGTNHFNDRLDELFNQLRAGLKMVEAEELVTLLEELVERVDSRMVARYGHGNRPCPSSACRHRQDDGALTSRSQCPCENTPQQHPIGPQRNAPQQDHPTTPTKEKAKKIVMTAVTNAIEQTHHTTRLQTHFTRTASPTRPGAKSPTGRSCNILSKVVRQSSSGNQQHREVVRPPIADTTESGTLAFQTVTAGDAESNRAFALRREARGSLARYTNERCIDALMSAMPFDDDNEESASYEVQSPPRKSPESRSPVSNTCRNAQSMSRQHSDPDESRDRSSQCWSPTTRRSEIDDQDSHSTSPTNDTYAQRAELNRSAGKYSSAGSQSKPVFQSVQREESEDMFPIEPTTPCKTFKRVQPPRRMKEQQSKGSDVDVHEWQDVVGIKHQMQVPSTSKDHPEYLANSSDEDVWWNARDRFSSSNVRLSPSYGKSTTESENKFISPVSMGDDKNDAILRTQGSGVVQTGGCTDTNLIFSVHRTLRESLPKFTGNAKRSAGLMHIVGSILATDEVTGEDYCPYISYADLEELKGNESSGDAFVPITSIKHNPKKYTAPTTTTTTRDTAIRFAQLGNVTTKDDNQQLATQTVDAFRDALRCSCKRTCANCDCGRSRNEILKVVKDSKENIKVELTVAKEDQSQLAEFMSSFIDAQRKSKHEHVEAKTQTYGCVQCGKTLNREVDDCAANRLTTNNNRSSTPCSPVRSVSPTFSKSTKSSPSNESESLPRDLVSSPSEKISSSGQSSPRPTSPTSSISKLSSVGADNSSSSCSETPRSVSPALDMHSEGYSSAHEAEEFQPTAFLTRNSMYNTGTKNVNSDEPSHELELDSRSGLSRKRSGGFTTSNCAGYVQSTQRKGPDGFLDEGGKRTSDSDKGKAIANKGSFVGEICGCN